MSIHRTDAFVLRTYSLKEADKICVFFTREQGKVRGVAHGARRMKSRFGSALEPFTEVSLSYFQKEGRELVSVSTCDIVQSHFDCAARDVETASAFSYLAELLSEFLPDHEPNDKLYRLVLATLTAIEGHAAVHLMLRYFETWLLRLTGFFADVPHCTLCDRRAVSDEIVYLANDGSPRCVSCSEGRGLAIDSALRTTIAELFRVPPGEFAQMTIPQDQLSRLGEINYQIIRHALERDLRSRSLLKT